MPVDIKDIRTPGLTIPDVLVLDTSLVLQPSAPPSGRHKTHFQDCMTFLAKVEAAVEAGDCLAVLPYFAYEECIHNHIRWELDKLSGGDWRTLSKARRAALVPTLYGHLEALRADWLDIYWIPESEDLDRTMLAPIRFDERLLTMSRDFQIMPRDATIIATAERLQTRNLASVDRDWSRADGFTVYCIP